MIFLNRKLELFVVYIYHIRSEECLLNRFFTKNRGLVNLVINEIYEFVFLCEFLPFFSSILTIRSLTFLYHKLKPRAYCVISSPWYCPALWIVKAIQDLISNGKLQVSACNTLFILILTYIKVAQILLCAFSYYEISGFCLTWWLSWFLFSFNFKKVVNL